MRIVVTGAGGFVGTRLIRDLAGYDVTALDRTALALPTPRSVQGDVTNTEVVQDVFAHGVEAVVHLATIPGGAAEQDPVAAWKVNVEATTALADALVRCGRGKRFVFASSIAALGDLTSPVNDHTPLRPTLLYGAHKAMAEQWLATRSRRGDIDAISLRFPGIVARPLAPSGMKSAFMSDVFHAALSSNDYVMPVSEEATVWLMSVEVATHNLRHALEFDGRFGEPYAVTLPALRASIGELVSEISSQTGKSGFVTYEPDDALESIFGRLPPLETELADGMGFVRDNSLRDLVSRSLSAITGEPSSC